MNTSKVQKLKKRKIKIFVGTSGYGYKEWKGKFYPEKLPPKEMLPFYAKRFQAVEINNTFYHMPTEAVLTSWAEQVPDDFIFTIKAPQIITHLKRLKSVEAETEYFFNTLSILGNKLGPVLFLFSKTFHADPPRLHDFLALIPRKVSCAFKFRSPTWLNDEIYDLLQGKGFSLCFEDTDEDPVGNIFPTAPWGYLRLRRSDYTAADLSQWLDKIRAQPWEKVFAFFKHEEEAKGPKLAMQFSEFLHQGKE